MGEGPLLWLDNLRGKHQLLGCPVPAVHLELLGCYNQTGNTHHLGRVTMPPGLDRSVL
jgi:hypothetical protein